MALSTQPDITSRGARDIHRIGGGNVANLRLKPAEKGLAPPGISVLRAMTPGAAASQIRASFPNATALHALSRIIGSTSEELVTSSPPSLLIVLGIDMRHEIQFIDRA